MVRVIITLILLPLLVATPVWGSTAPTQFDVRTTGLDTNGGGYDATVTVPGTDYSQQNSPQYSFTDLTVGVSTDTFTSALNPVVAGMVGNVVQIASGSGCTPGFYTIKSQAAGVATVDNSMGSSASVCVAKLGGSLLTVAKAMTALGGSDSSQSVVWIKSGTYTQTSALQCNTSPWVAYVGFATTHGDNGTRPLITTATNSTVLCEFNNTGVNGGQTWQNINFSNTAGTRAAAFNSSGPRGALQLINCTLDGFSTAITSATIGSGGYSSVILDGVEIKNSTGTGIEMGVFNTITDVFKVNNSNIHNNGGAGITMTRIMNTSIERTLITDNTGAGILISLNAQLLSFFIDSNTIANNTGSGIDGSAGGSFVTPTANAMVAIIIHRNNVYYGNGGWGVNLSAGAVEQVPIGSNYNNAYGSNTSGATNNFTAGTNDKTITANPFVSSTNYALNSVTGGGALLKGAGYPGVFPGGLTTGGLDIGAVQSVSGTPQHAYATAQ